MKRRLLLLTDTDSLTEAVSEITFIGAILAGFIWLAFN